MGLTVRRKTAKNLTVNRKSHYPIETLTFEQYFTFRANFEQHMSSKTF